MYSSLDLKRIYKREREGGRQTSRQTEAYACGVHMWCTPVWGGPHQRRHGVCWMSCSLTLPLAFLGRGLSLNLKLVWPANHQLPITPQLESRPHGPPLLCSDVGLAWVLYRQPELQVPQYTSVLSLASVLLWSSLVSDSFP